jgi:predicted RNA-binding Zn-ribbon protein involved in translation (DUF1610 family)
VIHRRVEIQALCVRERRHIVFPCDDLGEYDIMRSLYARFNEQPCDDLGSSVEIQDLCLREKRRIVFPCDDLGEYDIVRSKFICSLQ